MSLPPLRFAFDFISPFAYLGWHALQPIAAAHGRTIEPYPVLFAAFLKEHKQLGPAEIPSKRAYLVDHLQRQAQLLGLPFGLPPAHPFNPLAALRMAAFELPPEPRAALITALFAEVWGPHARGLTDHDVLTAVAADFEVPFPASPLLKSRVIDNTQQALDDGAFGVPTVWVDGHMFFGVDSFPHLEAHLAGSVRLDDALTQRWKTLPQHHRPR